MKRLIFVLVILFKFSNSLVYCQFFLDFDKLSIEDGLTSSRANVIIQDEKGFIWFGTWNGLNRYDGYSCEVFQPNYHDSTALSNREVSALLEDHNGNIWIGTTSGLNCLNPATNKLRRYNFQNRIISLFEDKEYQIWIGTWNGGLFKLDSASGDTENFFSTDIVSDIHEDIQGNFWVSTYYGLISFDRSTKSYIRFLPDENSTNSISHTAVTQIAESKDGHIWLSTWGGGLSKLIVNQDRDKMRFVNYKSREGKGSLSSNAVYRLYYDQFDNLWAGTWNAGLNLLEKSQQDLPPEEAKFLNFKNDLSDPYSLSEDHISAICVDKSGILWVGSSKIERTNIFKSGINRYKTIRFESGILTRNRVSAFESYKDNLVVGTSDEIKLFNIDRGEVELKRNIPKISYNSGAHNLISNSVLSLLQSEKGLWIGTEDAGLVLYPDSSFYKSEDKNPTYFNTYTNPRIPGNKVICLESSKVLEGTIWIGTMQYGFSKLYYENGKPQVRIFNKGYSEDFISDNNIRSVVEDKNGKVWIGTQNGLNCYDPQEDKFEKYFYSQTDTTSINNNVINILFEDSKGNLWVGTNLGLNKIQMCSKPNGEKKVCFKSYQNQEGIDNEIISNILEDDYGNLWIGLYRGILKFDIQKEVLEKEYFAKEYQHVVVGRNTALKGPDGNLFFGGANGFLYFNPDSIVKNSKYLKTCITGLIINNENIDNNSEYTEGKSIPYVENINLTYKDKIVTFVFSAMNYKDPKKNRYSYILEGLDKKWNDVGTRNTATYTNIKSGEYTFKVKAANSDGIWDDEYSSITIKVSPPFWKSIFAYIVYGIIFIGLLYFFNQYSIIEIREKGRIKIESIQYEKVNELNESKSLFFTNITHEFRTPLTLILGPAEELLKSKELSKYSHRQVELIQRNAQRLLRLVNQLMEFRKVEKDKMEIYLQQVDVALILNDIYDSFKSMAESKDMEFILTLQKEELRAAVDVEKFEKALFNVVSNAFKYTEESGKITIWAGLQKVQENDFNLVIEVEDSGIGIAEEHLSKVFDRFFQANNKQTQSTGGIGLYLSKAFIEMHNGKIELESELGLGSCFRITIPVKASDDILEERETERVEKLIEQENTLEEIETNDSTVRISNESSANSISKVLIIEDDGELNEFIVSGLSSEFLVFGCYNGKEGLEIARKQNPDIIITDIMMPEMDGIELCKLLRKDLSTSHIPVIFLTAKTMQEDEIKGLKIGAVDYIYKPFNLISLKLKIRNQLENKKGIHGKIQANKIMEPEMIELSDLDETFLRNAVDAVNSHLDDPTFDVEKFSQVIGISANQVYRKIKALTGQTAKEFIRNQRLKTAAQFFLQKKRSISEIIYMVGFSSPSYFTRCFKEYYGCTPREYIDNDGKVD